MYKVWGKSAFRIFFDKLCPLLKKNIVCRQFGNQKFLRKNKT